jgi:hypothetical protein
MRWLKANKDAATGAEGMKLLMDFIKGDEPDEAFSVYEAFIRVMDIKKIGNESMSTFVDRFTTSVTHLENQQLKFPESLRAMMIIHRSGVDTHARRQLLSSGVGTDGQLVLDRVVKEIKRLFHDSSKVTAYVADGDFIPAAPAKGLTKKDIEGMFEGFLAKQGLKLGKRKPKAKPKPGARDTSTWTCFWCQKVGHIKANCPDRRAGLPQTKKPEGGLACDHGQEEWSEAYVATLPIQQEETQDQATTEEVEEYLAETSRWGLISHGESSSSSSFR